MVVKTVERKVRCDTLGCRENAKYSLSTTEGGRRTFLCASCAEAIHRAVMAETVPESPTSIFLKKSKAEKKDAIKSKGEN